MTEFQLQIDAPIIPNQSLGGLGLRTSIVEIQDVVMELQIEHLTSKRKLFSLPSPFEAKYEFENEKVTVCVDVRNGKIYQLTALPGYMGLLFDKIYVGMRVADAMALEPDLYYDEATEIIRCKGCPGLAIDVPEIDPPPELVPRMAIHAINVYAKEAFTPTGNRGQW
ncbi:MAG: hypothetical protein SXV54_11205 [Chloroflexota bacterium]|nr:hypothetical protein [Chloroflexota bacterium]